MGLVACPATSPAVLWPHVRIFLYSFQYFSTLEYRNKKAGKPPLSSKYGVLPHLPNVRFQCSRSLPERSLSERSLKQIPTL